MPPPPPLPPKKKNKKGDDKDGASVLFFLTRIAALHLFDLFFFSPLRLASTWTLDILTPFFLRCQHANAVFLVCGNGQIGYALVDGRGQPDIDLPSNKSFMTCIDKYFRFLYQLWYFPVDAALLFFIFFPFRGGEKADT